MQGAGHVAYHLCSYLRSEGAIVYVTDIYEEKARRIVNDFGAIYVKPEEIYDQEAHIFCPAALGGVLNSDTIPRLKVDIVAGPSNNQLRDEAVHEHMLIERDILYVPDFVINAGVNQRSK
jgi:leucine dehydrogenase